MYAQEEHTHINMQISRYEQAPGMVLCKDVVIGLKGCVHKEWHSTMICVCIPRGRRRSRFSIRAIHALTNPQACIPSKIHDTLGIVSSPVEPVTPMPMWADRRKPDNFSIITVP